MSTLYVDNVKTVSGTTTFADGQFGGTVNSSATVGGHAVTTKPSSPVAGQLYFDTTQKALFIYDGTSWTLVGPTVANFGTASGGTETIVDGFKIHSITTTGSIQTFTVSGTVPIIADLLICAGGGSGGGHHGAGAGAGELILAFGMKMWPGTYKASIGTGATGVAYDTHGLAGNNTYFYSEGHSWGRIEAGGGGSGAMHNNSTYVGGRGGSGGGMRGTVEGHRVSIPGPADYSTSRQYELNYVNKMVTGTRGGTFLRLANDGGGNAYESPHYGMGGGGGAASPGKDGEGEVGAAGGDGVLSDITGTDTYYCAGGGGSTYNGDGSEVRNAGLGGVAGVNTGSPGIDATTYGSGGGGYDRSGSPNISGAGKQGIVIIRYRNYSV